MVTCRLSRLAASCLVGASLWSAQAEAAASLRKAGAEARKAGFPASHTELGKAEADEYRRQFAQIDRDANGKITAAELAKALSRGDEPDAAAVPPADAAQATASPVKAVEAAAASASEVAAAVAAEEAPVAAPRPEPIPLPGQGLQLLAEEAPQQLLPDMPQQQRSPLGSQAFFKNDLAFVHVPANLGLPVERAALEGNREEETPFLLHHSFNAKTLQEQWEQIDNVKGGGGQVWGQMFPELREVSNYSGCNLVYEPPKHWPAAVAKAYFGTSRAFGLLRDPYDRMVSEFRHQAANGGKQPGEQKRSDVSQREGSLEREGPQYQALYANCNVSSWVKEELRRYRAGDIYRGNCHLLPQAEYFEHPHGVTLPIDVRTLPDSFNGEMERHGYMMRLRPESIHASLACSKLSVWDLDDEAKELIREVYAADFGLVCRHFGYCDDRELTCLAQIPFMCGAAASAPS